MFYSLLDALVCPACRHGLTMLLPIEAPQSTTMRMAAARRASPAGAIVGPLPATAPDSPLTRALAPLASAPADDGRDKRVAVSEGVLACVGCHRWYPVRQGLPEVLPDHLRDPTEDRKWLDSRRSTAGAQRLAAAWRLLEAPPLAAMAAAQGDAGAHYKLAEIGITRRALPDGFFGWALVAPFNASSPMFSFDLLARYLTTVSRLGCGVNGVVFDLGVGTGWTTEWLVRLGYQAIGLDLCKDYVLAGMPRRGEYLPHYVIGDTENIPLRDSCVDAALSFDAFHHVPNRPRAMAELARIMRAGATMAITEPGIDHEHAAVSIDVMKQHGILERGFDQAGLEGYIRGLLLGEIRKFNSDTHPHDIYTLRKLGAFQTDSLAPRALVAAMSPDPPPALRTGEALPLSVTIINTGDTVWLANTPDEFGEVHLGAQLFDASHRLLEQDYARVLLPHDVKPGDAVRLYCALPPLLQPGDYIVELDMVDTGFLWFKDYAYQPTQWPVSVAGTATPGAPLVVKVGTGGPGSARIRPESLPAPPPAALEAPAPPPVPTHSLLRRVAGRVKRAYRRASA